MGVTGAWSKRSPSILVVLLLAVAVTTPVAAASPLPEVRTKTVAGPVSVPRQPPRTSSLANRRVTAVKVAPLTRTP